MPEKDPTTWGLATWLLALGMASGGGAVNWYAKVKRGNARAFNVIELIGEIFTSGFIGLGAFMLLAAMDQPMGVCAAAAGVGGVFTGTQYGYIGRNANASLLRNWFENIPYPVRILNSNIGEGGGNITAVAGAEPAGTYALSNFVDGYSYNGEFTGNFFARGYIDLNLSGITGGPCRIGQNISQMIGNGGVHLFSNQSGSQMIIDSGDIVIAPVGTYLYKNLIYGRYVSLFQGETTGAFDAPVGNIGEYVESSIAVGSPVSLSNNVAANITSISLTAGDWEVWGTGALTLTGATVSAHGFGISTVSATFQSDRHNASSLQNMTTTTGVVSVSVPRNRRQLGTTTTVYLVGKANFSAGTVGGYGTICARRIR